MNKDLNINFSEPDQYGEIHADLTVPLSLDAEFIYLNLSINNGQSIKFHFYYYDPGTMGYAVVEGRHVIKGRLTNVDIDWNHPDKTDAIRIINVVGSLKNGKANLHLWTKAKKTSPLI